MQSPFSPRDDAGIPVLTEVLDIPLPPSARAPRTAPSGPASLAGEAGPAAMAPTGPHPAAPRGPDLETQIETLRTTILQDLLDRVDPLLKTRMRAALEVAAARALGDIADHLREELGRMVDEAVQKELIRREAADIQARSRPQTEE